MRVPRNYTIDLNVIQQLEKFVKEKNIPKSRVVEAAVLKYLEKESKKQKEED